MSYLYVKWNSFGLHSGWRPLCLPLAPSSRPSRKPSRVGLHRIGWKDAGSLSPSAGVYLGQAEA
jgi:hypothetical protein